MSNLLRTTRSAALGVALAAGAWLSVGQAGAAIITADFEDLTALVDVTPLTTQGVDFTSDGPNLVFGPADNSGALNGTNTFGWCGSGCGGTQLVTASIGGTPFTALSIDAGNLQEAGQPLGFFPGMTLELLGNIFGGGTVSQSLVIVEDVMTTFNLVGFTNIVSLELTAPEVVGVGTPDPVIDNLVIDTAAVPEPSSFVLFGLGVASLAAWRRRRRW